MRIAIINHNTSDIIKARCELIKSIKKCGHDVVVIGNEDVLRKKIESLGVEFRNIPYDRISINIINNLKYIFFLSKVLKEEKVDAILAYTIKPIISGAIAGNIAKIKKKYALVVGMGYNYSINTPKIRMIRFFCNIGYKIAGKSYTKMIFQNKEDRDELVKKKFVKLEKAVVIDGSGVNMNEFIKSDNKISSMKKLKFLMISRGLNVKGIKELSLAAKKVHEIYPDVEFIHIGKIDKTYRGISDKEIEIYSKNIKFEGKVNNVYDYIKKSNIVVLPSYLREGIPRVLLEGLAVGRPIITTNMRGCKETVVDGKNGFLVNPRDEKDLTEKILKMINCSKKEIQEMSEFSYNLAKERFDVNIINKKMLEYMELN